MLKNTCKPFISLQGTGRDFFNLFEFIQSAGPSPLPGEGVLLGWWVSLVTVLECLQDRVLYRSSRHFCASSLYHHHHPCVYLVQGKGKAKTNKQTSSVSFITGQPLISTGTVVSLQCCHLICLSLSKTCLCGPVDRMHARSRNACGLVVGKVYRYKYVLLNDSFFIARNQSVIHNMS